MFFYLILLFFSHFNSCQLRNAHKHDRVRSASPNIIIILTDDQDVELGSLYAMPKLFRFIGDQGVIFKNAFTTTPMCCPSRSSILTGMYVHNHNTYTNNDNCSSAQWRQTHETRNFGTYLSNAGYRTGYFGKYLNEYMGDYRPPGWLEWMGLIRNTRYYNYTLNHNGVKIKHENVYENDYLTDVITNNSINFFRQSKTNFPEKAVAMVLSMPAPHGPEDAAPQYQHMFKNTTSHHTRNWNFAPNPDKQWLLQYTDKMQPIQKHFTDVLQMKRLQTLQSVDDAIEKIWREVITLREHHNTYFIFTSDHGYHLGQYGLVKGKAMPYEFDIKIPFFMRGPKISSNLKLSNIVLNLDIAPTLLDIAGVQVPPHMDGESVMKLFDQRYQSFDPNPEFRKSQVWRDTFLVERGKLTPRKLKLQDKLEAKMNNLEHLQEQKSNDKCQFKKEYKSPCSPNQKWECRKISFNHYKMVRCQDTKCSCNNDLEIPNNNIDETSDKSNGKKWTNFEIKSEKISIPCRLELNMSITCEESVYKDPRSWLKYKHSLTKLIHQFSDKLLFFKKIRDHLKLKRPFKSINSNFIQDKSDHCDCKNEDEPTRELGQSLNIEAKHLMGTIPDFTSSQVHGGNNASETWKGVNWSQYRSREDPFCHVDGLECTRMDNDHWKVPPLWTEGPFCFCPNSNNNTYWCLRTINSTHNFIYCEFITGFISYFNINTDPYELRNAVHDLKYSRLHHLHQQLEKMKGCKGRKCNPKLVMHPNEYSTST